MLDLSDEELLESQDVSDLIEEPSSGALPAVRSNLPVKVKEEKDISHQLDLLQKYFREIRKYPLLTKEDEYDLAVQFTETGDPKLAFRLTTSNLRLVVKIAMEYQSAVANLLDLIQEGNIGLMQAVKKFDPFKGIRLSSYAQWWIRAYILKYLVNNARMVKVGTTQAQRKLFFNLRKEKDRLEALGFKPEPALLAERLDVRVEEVNEMEQRLARADVSLDAPLGDDQKSRVSDMMATDDMDVDERVIERELHQRIRGFMNDFAKGLKDRERVIWLKRLTSDEPLTLQEIGDLFGVTRERARQIEKDLTRRFREYLQKHMPDLDASDLLP
ncbi:MAG: RNA polymerase factor sigma-32 [Myxococcales bacterium]|nr:RNA polymerase factor sigma-32 [Myxococcales bacterium]